MTQNNCPFLILLALLASISILVFQYCVYIYVIYLGFLNSSTIPAFYIFFKLQYLCHFCYVEY